MVDGKIEKKFEVKEIDYIDIYNFKSFRHRISYTKLKHYRHLIRIDRDDHLATSLQTGKD